MIENAIASNEAVDSYCVIGVNDQKYKQGKLPVACVALKEVLRLKKPQLMSLSLHCAKKSCQNVPKL